MKKKILNSQAGISLVQVLLTAATMGGLALVMSKMAQNQGKVQMCIFITFGTSWENLSLQLST